jgi:phospholipid/cholesterol/gamma-HCH transport system substrate-binding protein
MSESRIELKVGVFVLLALALLAVLLLSFSKGVTLFQPTYDIRMITPNIGGLRPKANVLMAGVPVGTVVETSLAPDGRTVVVVLRIHEQYKIHADAEFVIDALGLLGDQYVGIRPTRNEGPVLRDGDEVYSLEPFNLQEVARASVGFIQRIDRTAETINDAVARIDKLVLNEETLTNLAVSMQNFRAVSERAFDTVEGIDSLFQENADAVGMSISNLVTFSEQLNDLADVLTETIVTNRTEMLLAVKNLEGATKSMRNVLEDVEAGRGVVGSLVKDEALRQDVSLVISNFSVLSSNLNRYGLLYRPRQPRPEREPTTPWAFPGRRPQ